jgi:hypothetical protein
MLKFLKELDEKLKGKRPYKTKVVCESIAEGNRFTLYYKRFIFSKYRYVTDPNGEPMRYATYLEAAAAAYMASITSMRFFNNI